MNANGTTIARWVRLCLSSFAALMLAIAGIAQENDRPEQVNVAVKIVEFQSDKMVETGFSAYYARRVAQQTYGSVSGTQGRITSADLTFPVQGSPTITVFLDRMSIGRGDIEMVLQALVEENRAYILSRPKAMVMLGESTTIGTTQSIPYQSSKVVGTTTTQVTEFRDTGVNLKITLNDIVDDDGDWTTTSDQFIRLAIEAEVSEAGQQFVIALDDQVASGSNFAQAQNVIQAPEFVTRRMETEAWVRNGQVLVLGGLYRRSNQKSIRTAPWLMQAETTAVGLAEQFIPGNFLASPVSATIGNRGKSEGFRELVFIIKADVWRQAFSAFDFQFGQDEVEERSPRISPTDIITDILQIPRGIAEELTGSGSSEPRPGGSVQRSLGPNE